MPPAAAAGSGEGGRGAAEARARGLRRKYCARAAAGAAGGAGGEPRFSADLQGLLVTAAGTDPYRIGRAAFSLLRTHADVFREAEGLPGGGISAAGAGGAGGTEGAGPGSADGGGGGAAAAAGPPAPAEAPAPAGPGASAGSPAPAEPPAGDPSPLPGEDPAPGGFDLFDAGIPLGAPLPGPAALSASPAPPAPAAPEIGGPPSPTPTGAAGARAEILRLRERDHRFFRVKPGAKGTLFVGWARDPRFLGPNEAALRLLEAAALGKAMGEIRSAVPVLHTSKARPEAISRALGQCLAEVLGPAPPGGAPVPVELRLTLRNSSALTREQLREAALRGLEEWGAGRARPVEAYGAYVAIVCVSGGNAMMGAVENRGLYDFSFLRASSAAGAAGGVSGPRAADEAGAAAGTAGAGPGEESGEGSGEV